MNKKCILLYSGGLDSLLAFVYMKSKGFEVVPLFVDTPFYNKKIRIVERTLRRYGGELVVVSDAVGYWSMLRNPRFGYGANLNPCVDCKVFMYRKAKEYMERIGASFLVTGEVLGQRPMSQRNYPILRAIEKAADLRDLVLRPLSGRLLPPTAMEREGIINREELLDLSGRSRKRQFELARRFGIDEFESPAGGCLLTDKQFSARVKVFLDRDMSEDEIKAFKIGRHFLINGFHFVVSRGENENRKIKELGKNYPLVVAKDGRGACGVFFGTPGERELAVASAVIMRYSKKAEGVEYCFGGESYSVAPANMTPDEIGGFMVR